MIARVLICLLSVAAIAGAGDVNSLVLQQIAAMPHGGGYAATHHANEALATSVQTDGGKISVTPARAEPSYCSGATYLVFLGVLRELDRTGRIAVDPATWNTLRPLPTMDGNGLWGRWNANGPGTARLFYELGLGPNFTDFSQAEPGDFMKVFWNSEVGRDEHGHSVIFLGTEQKDGQEYVRFWSSNVPGGFGEKSVPRHRIVWAIFSRLTNPQKITGWPALPKKDSFLAGLLDQNSSVEEVKQLTGLRD